MSDTFAYDNGLSCHNPSCKSNGSSHPNCKCYSEHYADGGKVEFHCEGMHQPECQYFQDGGIATGFDEASAIPVDSQVSNASQSQFDPSSAISDQEEHPEDFPDTNTQSPPTQFDPESATLGNTNYGTTGQQALAGAEGVAQGVTGPLIPSLESAGNSVYQLGKWVASGFKTPDTLEEANAGLHPFNAKEQLARQEANPWTHGIGETAGLVGGVLTGTGIGSTFNNAAESAVSSMEANSIGKAAIQGAISSGLFQGNDEVSKMLLNDPEASASSALTNIGATGLLGLGTGAVGGLIGKGLDKFQIGSKIDNFLQGAGNASLHPDLDLEARYPSWTYVDRIAKDAQGNPILDELGNPTKYQARIPNLEDSSSLYARPKNALKSEYPYQKVANIEDMGGADLNNPQNWGKNKYTLANGDSFNQDELLAGYGNPDKQVMLTGPEARKQYSNYYTNNMTRADKTAWNAGQQFYDTAISRPMVEGGVLGGIAGVEHSNKEDSALETGKNVILGSLAGAASGAAFGYANKRWVAPTLMKLITSPNAHTIIDALNHANDVSQGAKLINSGINNLFKATPQQIFNSPSNLRDRERLKKYIGLGGINQNIQQEQQNLMNTNQPQQFAEGGYVDIKPQQPMMPTANTKIAPLIKENDGIADHFPQQNIIMNAAKSRISNYLSGLQPQMNQPKLAFDSHPDTKMQERSYNTALDIANNPLSVLDKLGNGTLTPDHVSHLNQLYPEVNQEIQKKITKRITEAQLKGEKPSYKVRQGLSMLMGTPLSGEMVPSSIQAAQAVFASQQTQNQPTSQPKQKRKTAILSKAAGQYQTQDQARQARQDKV